MRFPIKKKKKKPVILTLLTGNKSSQGEYHFHQKLKAARVPPARLRRRPSTKKNRPNRDERRYLSSHVVADIKQGGFFFPSCFLAPTAFHHIEDAGAGSESCCLGMCSVSTARLICSPLNGPAPPPHRPQNRTTETAHLRPFLIRKNEI